MIESIYFAGPDVFRSDVNDWRKHVIEICQAHGVLALLPCDTTETNAKAIRATNIQRLEEASAIIANLTPFRGVEVDTGTAFEVGYACALHKPIVGFATNLESLEARVERLYGPLAESRGAFSRRDRDGFGVEEFSLPTNLMIAAEIPIVAGDVDMALGLLLQEHRLFERPR